MSYPPPNYSGYDGRSRPSTQNTSAQQFSYAQQYNTSSHYGVQDGRNHATQYYTPGNQAPGSSLPTSIHYQQQQYYSPQPSPQLQQSYQVLPRQQSYQDQTTQQGWQQPVPSPQFAHYSAPLTNGMQPNSYSNVNFAQQQPNSYLPQPSFSQVQTDLSSYGQESKPHIKPSHPSGYQQQSASLYKQEPTGTRSQVPSIPPRPPPGHLLQVASTSMTQMAQEGSMQPRYIQNPNQPSFVVDRSVPTAKRRKSNDGTAVHATAVSASGSASKQPPQRPTIATPTASSSTAYYTPPSQQQYQQVAEQPKRQEEDLVSMDVLLCLAEEYVTTAHSLARIMDGDDLEQYQKLISTALACLKSALTDFPNNDTRKEAYTRLKLATLLFEETDSHDEAIDILSKGVSNCERSRLPDLRYTMQYLLIRIIHKKNASGAAKIAEKMIGEVETLHWQHWIFAFRMLKLSLNFDDGAVDNASNTRQLAAINELAKKAGLVALEVLASCLEASTRLRVATTESFRQAERSLAAVRQHQLHPEFDGSPQLRALLSMLTMSCHILSGNTDQMQTTLHTMQGEHEKCSKAKGWREDGLFVIPISRKTGEHFIADTAGLFKATDDGGFALAFMWMTKGVMLTMGYVLSCFAALPKSGETMKSETYLKEALKILDASSTTLQRSHTINSASRRKQQYLSFSLRLLMGATFAARAAYRQSLEVLTTLHNDIAASDLPYGPFKERMKFYTAVTCQGLGEAARALDLYKKLHSSFDPEDKTPSSRKDMQVLAIMNSIHIMRVHEPNNVERARELMALIQPYCEEHPNKSFSSIYHIIEATCTAEDTQIMTLKKSLNQALVPAQTMKNKQLLTLIMSKLSDMFFTDVVGTQAIKSSNAARTLAKHAGDDLWVAVGCGMLRDTYEKGGQLKEALEANKSAQEAVDQIPEKEVGRFKHESSRIRKL